MQEAGKNNNKSYTDNVIMQQNLEKEILDLDLID